MWVYEYTYYSMLLRAPGELFRQRATIPASFLEIILIFLFFLCVFINNIMLRYRLCLVNLFTSRNIFWHIPYKSIEAALDGVNKTRDGTDELKTDTAGLHLFRVKTTTVKRRRSIYIILDESHPLFNISTLDDAPTRQSIPEDYIYTVGDHTKNMLQDIAEQHTSS